MRLYILWNHKKEIIYNMSNIVDGSPELKKAFKNCLEKTKENVED